MYHEIGCDAQPQPVSPRRTLITIIVTVMKTISFLSLALLQLTISPGLALYTGTGFGDHLSGTNASLFRNSTQTTPNIASVPFKVGDVDFRLEIRSSTLDGMGNTTSAVFTQYSLLWDDQADLNDTVRQAEGLGDDERPRLCATLPLSFFDAQATNAYDEDEPGSCAGPLGKKCFDSLTSAGFGGAVDDCTTPILPDECTNKLPGGGLGTACKMPSSLPRTAVDADCTSHSIQRNAILLRPLRIL